MQLEAYEETPAIVHHATPRDSRNATTRNGITEGLRNDATGDGGRRATLAKSNLAGNGRCTVVAEVQVDGRARWKTRHKEQEAYSNDSRGEEFDSRSGVVTRGDQETGPHFSLAPRAPCR
jgi:hypothetical protein